MRWYKHLYVGEKAKKKRFSMIQGLRRGKVQPGVHVIVPAAGEKNILDILSAAELTRDYYKKKPDLLILGIAANYFEALEVAGKIVHDMYTATAGFELEAFLEIKEQR